MSSKWYVIWTDNPAISQRLQEQKYQVAELGSPILPKLPAIASTWHGGVVTSVQGPYPTEAAAEKAIGSPGHSSGTGEGSGPGHANPTGPNLPSNPVGAFLAKLGQAATWIRVAEVVLGLALIVVGLAKITGAGELAKKAAKVAAKTGLAAA